MKIAVITGASSGLGREFVRQAPESVKELDEIWAIARRRDRLLELQELTNVKVRAVDMDLTLPESVSRLESMFREAQPEIKLLICAAGFGKIGSWEETGREDSDRMIDLNCRAAVDVTYAAIPYMKRGSRIMEICSTAAFQPFQYLNVYAATKAFLYRFSRALRVELIRSGIRVTAVCPYWIRDTEFIPTAKKTAVENRRIRHFPGSSKAKDVAALALKDSEAGLPVSTPSPVAFVHRVAAKFIPHEAMMWLWALIRRI